MSISLETAYNIFKRHDLYLFFQNIFIKRCQAGQFWRTPLIPALGKQRQVDFCEFENSLVYKSEFQDSLQSHCFEKTDKKKMSVCVGTKMESCSQIPETSFPIGYLEKYTAF